MLQCVAVCCSVLQFVAVCCSVLQCVAMCCSVLQCVAGYTNHKRQRQQEGNVPVGDKCVHEHPLGEE